MNKIVNIQVERMDADILRLSWEAKIDDLSVSIYQGELPDSIDRNTPLACVTGQNFADFPGLDPNIRYYFAVVPDGGPENIIAERRVPIEETHNFRDLGGYATQNGRRVKWGRAFRADGLARIRSRGRALLKQMGIRLVCDFRAPTEIDQAPDNLPEDGSIEYLNLPIVSHGFDTVEAMKRLRKGDTSWLTDTFMPEGYIRNIEGFAPIWGTVIQNLSLSENRALVFHCTAGKDRTGICAALILLVLGVPQETVIYDHGLSNVYLGPFLEKFLGYLDQFGVDRNKILPYLSAPREAIVAALDHIGTQYGSAEKYLLSKAGISQETLDLLKQELLE